MRSRACACQSVRSRARYPAAACSADRAWRQTRGKCAWPLSATGCRMSTPWEQLISSTMTPTTAVAVKLAVTDEPPEPTDPNGTVLPGGSATAASTTGGIFGTLHRHIPILSRLSLNKSDKAHCRLVGNYCTCLARVP